MSTPGRSNKLHYTSAGLPALLSIEQVAEALGLSDRTIRRWIKDGNSGLKVHRIGPRILRIERDSVLGPVDAA